MALFLCATSHRKEFIIAGHGAGDPGATGNGYTEAERVRALAARIGALGGSNVTIADTSRNWYADNGISKLSIPKDYQIIELHMDRASASARGGHVIINGKYKADQSLHGRKKCQRYNSQYQDPISHKSILFTFQGPFKILFRKRLSLLYGRHISMTPAKQPYIRRCPGNDHTCQQQSQKKLHGICKQFPWILQILIHSPYF